MSQMTTLALGICVLGIAALAGGCAMEDKKTEKQVAAMPVNCATAEGDMRTLESEKKGVAAKIGAGVSMIVPIGLVTGVATGTEGTKYQVTTGEYNAMLDKKIAEIKQTCTLPG
jgi:hypothetical protein